MARTKTKSYSAQVAEDYSAWMHELYDLDENLYVRFMKISKAMASMGGSDFLLCSLEVQKLCSDIDIE